MKNYSAHRLFTLGCIAFVLFCGCAAAPAKVPVAEAIPPELRVLSLSPDKPSPQVAEKATIHWKADAGGGVGPRSFEYFLDDGKGEKSVQSGPMPLWVWKPVAAGSYRIKVVVEDSIGNKAGSGWSGEYDVLPPLNRKSLLAVMPLENLSGSAAPLGKISKSLKDSLKSKGVLLLEDDALERFMEKHRIRYAGGLTQALGKAFQEETGTRAVMFLSLDHYDEAFPPKLALTARLVSAGEKTVILWMDGVSKAGNDAPGLLLLGLVNDPWVLWNRAKEEIANSLVNYLSGVKRRSWQGHQEESDEHREQMEKYGPKEFFRAQFEIATRGRKPRVAVLPFFNDSPRRNAGEIMTLHFVRALKSLDEFDIIDPGIVRQSLLMSRTIMEGGLSLPQADLLRLLLEVDIVVTGTVFDYGDYSGPLGNPKINFSAQAYNTKSRQIEWSSISFNQGDDWVIFFNQGKVNTAYGVASGMVRAVAEKMASREDGPETDRMEHRGP